MKPQCNTPAECLRELARVMEQFGIDCPVDAINSQYIKHTEKWSFAAVPDFSDPENWQFAFAEVEGKPVFIGDRVYDYAGNAHIVPYLNDGTKMTFGKGHKWSLTPHKPKTVMVELTVEDAAEFSGYGCFGNNHAPSVRLYQACKKALKESK